MPCSQQDIAPQELCGIMLLPRTHEGSCLSSCSPNTAFHCLFIAVKPFLTHLATAARTQQGFVTAKGTPAYWVLCQSALPVLGDTPLLQEGSSPRVSLEMTPSPHAFNGYEACRYVEQGRHVTGRVQHQLWSSKRNFLLQIAGFSLFLSTQRDLSPNHAKT